MRKSIKEAEECNFILEKDSVHLRENLLETSEKNTEKHGLPKIWNFNGKCSQNCETRRGINNGLEVHDQAS